MGGKCYAYIAWSSISIKHNVSSPFWVWRYLDLLVAALVAERPSSLPLQSLVLDGNGITAALTELMLPLFESIECHALDHISLDDNPLGDVGAQANIAYFIPYPRQISGRVLN